ncbi:MAG: SsrA-binding protein SmpB [Dehalococcoidia bacterium]|nr:MAG: SsrA-binding protein SmpB [Dehalococcoidia bacterium]
MSLKTITVNRKAYHDYHIEDSFEAGLVLTGTEIKSIRAGRVNLRDAYARAENGEMWLLGAHIAQYQAGNRYNHEPKRPRKLLLNRREIAELSSAMLRKGLTIVPLKLYLKNGIAKVEIGIARGKKAYDKREAIAQRDAQREVQRALSQRSPKGKS